MASRQDFPGERPTRAGRLLRAAPRAGQALGAAVACTLWLGVAAPGLELLPGFGRLEEESTRISLQSALLGIDDGTGRPAEERARAAAAVLGLTYAERLLASVASDSSGASADAAAGVVRLRAAAMPPSTPAPVREELVAAASPPAPAEVAAVPVATAAAAEPPPVTSPTGEPARTPPPRREPEPVVEPPALLRTQSLAFASTPPADAAVGGSYEIAATATSGLPVKLSASGAACRLSGSTVSFRSAGPCVVDARQPGNGKYAAAEARQVFEIGRVGQTVAFASDPPSPALVGGTYAVLASASSGLDVSIAAVGACIASGATVTFTGAGTCTLDAKQAGDEMYLPAPPARQSFQVAEPVVPLLSQAIAFTTAPPPVATVGGPAYVVGAIASSGLPVTLSVDTASAGVCAVSGSSVSMVGAGTCTIAADQAGGVAYAAAPRVVQSFTVARTAQTVSFTSSAPASATYGDPPYSVAATASSGLAVAFAVAPASVGVCTLSGSTVSIVGGGTCTIHADQGGSAMYETAHADQSFEVARSSQTITITSSNPGPVDRHSPPYTVTATTTSGLPVSFSIAPESAGNCSIAGATVTFARHGNCVVRANQAGDARYLPAPQIEQMIVVVPHV